LLVRREPSAPASPHLPAAPAALLLTLPTPVHRRVGRNGAVYYGEVQEVDAQLRDGHRSRAAAAAAAASKDAACRASGRASAASPVIVAAAAAGLARLVRAREDALGVAYVRAQPAAAAPRVLGRVDVDLGLGAGV
jgi:hypothetical protein